MTQNIDWVQVYINEVENGNLIVPKTILQLIERHKRDLQRTDIMYDPAGAARVIKFIELLPNLDTGERMKLALFQKFILSMLYNWQHLDGSRKYKEIFITLARKNGREFAL